MRIGDIVRHRPETYRDPLTGLEVRRLTSAGVLHHHPYFYYKMFSGDGRYLIHAMELPDGSRQLFRMDLNEGLSVQLTDDKDVHDFSCSLSSDDRRLFYCRGRQAVELDLSTGKERVVYETPSGWVPNANPGFSSDDKLLVLVEMKESDVIRSEGGWSAFEPQWAAKPHCRIVLVEIENGKSRIVHEEPDCWLGHPQIRPGDNSTILFCHEGPWYRIDARLWLVRSDGTGHTCARPHNGLELVTHEYWLADGSRFAYVHREGESGAETIRLMDPDTLQEEVLMACSRYCHFISNRDHSRIAGDGQSKEEPYIYIVDVLRKQERVVCVHGTSWKSYGNTQDAHPHPAFTPDGRSIVFTSDREGVPAIYMVDVTQLEQI